MFGRFHYVIAPSDLSPELVKKVEGYDNQAHLAFTRGDHFVGHVMLRGAYTVLGNFFLAYNEIRERVYWLRSTREGDTFTPEEQRLWDFCSHRMNVRLAMENPKTKREPMCCDNCGKAWLQLSVEERDKNGKPTKVMQRCTNCDHLQYAWWR